MLSFGLKAVFPCRRARQEGQDFLGFRRHHARHRAADGEVLRYRLRDRKRTLLLSEIELSHDSAGMFSIGRAIKGEKWIFIVDAEASYVWLSLNQT